MKIDPIEFCNVGIHYLVYNIIYYIIIFGVILEPVEPELFLDPVPDLARPVTYTTVFGVKRNTEIIRDNLGFMYYKNKT